MTKANQCRQAPVTVQAIGDDLLLLNTNTHRIHQLNPTASFIWRCCDRPMSAEEIAKLMSGRFAVDEHKALQDVVETLERLRELSLVVDEPPGTSDLSLKSGSP